MTGLSTASRICGLQSCSWASAIFLCVPIWAWALGVLFQVSAAPAAALPQSPSQPHSLRGRTQGLRHRGERSTAPIEHESQSFLSNNIAFVVTGVRTSGSRKMPSPGDKSPSPPLSSTVWLLERPNYIEGFAVVSPREKADD